MPSSLYSYYFSIKTSMNKSHFAFVVYLVYLSALVHLHRLQQLFLPSVFYSLCQRSGQKMLKRLVRIKKIAGG